MRCIWPTPEIEDIIVDVMDDAVEHVPGDGLHLLLEATRERVFRLADGEIHQTADRKDLRLIVTAIEGNRQGVVSTGLLVPDEIHTAIGRARRICSFLPPDPQFPGLPGPVKAAQDGGDHHDRETANATSEELARIASVGLETARAEGAIAAGALSVRENLFLARDSEGLASRSISTKADLSLTCFAGSGGKQSSGYSNRFAWRLSDLNPEETAIKAARKAKYGIVRRSLNPGFYTAILGPTAVADLVGILAHIGFGATEVNEYRSFASGRLGEKVLDEKFTLRDDPQHPQTAAPGIDYEGIPTKPLTFVERGVLKDIATNHRTAHLGNKPSNGRGADPLSRWTDILMNHLVMEPGATSREKMIRSVHRGILINRLWYARVVQPRETRITALTRNGLLTIDGGEITGAAGNFRTNLSLVELLSHLKAVSDTTVPTHGVVAPTLLVEGFPLTSPSA
ncbi:MAG: TldD/PmbA family protein [Candidatus Eisenbacteria bacterium]|uniref:TldD/PmbA family protein n=1 Tax=Eiseniibacteriota bacterium TaxID=2212470 RepID=A0A948W5H5_UNCEI|nr:TldD/PmbA family protein [Candidatus Eisenbacteria bacterium]MBU1949341.1 TldD/PmbA family protein [Candidatus Eisenbacteria bacterium]MBU2690414.1 TldD/PmbA family protein [Candidatus Eisenbacteria bacterium]